MKRKIVIFDLDDTLYKEIDFLKSAYQEIALWLEQEYEIRNVYNYMLSCYEQKKNVFSCVNNEYGLKVSLESYLYKYRMHIPVISLSADVDNLLKKMLDAGFILGIITDGRTVTQSNKIRALELERYISWENCIISESFGYSKPSPEAFLFFQHKYPNADYYYVGDNVSKDFIAPNQLGWTTVCLLDDGRNIHKWISIADDKKPQYKIPSFEELYKLVEKYR